MNGNGINHQMPFNSWTSLNFASCSSKCFYELLQLYLQGLSSTNRQMFRQTRCCQTFQSSRNGAERLHLIFSLSKQPGRESRQGRPSASLAANCWSETDRMDACVFPGPTAASLHTSACDDGATTRCRRSERERAAGRSLRWL